MQKNCITYSCILGAPNTLGIFLLAEKHRLGENLPLTYSDIWGSRNTLGNKNALHIRDIQAPPNKSYMR